MKELKLKLKEVTEAYRLLKDAKYQKLSDDDKVRVWKISRTLKPLAVQLDEDASDARQKFMPEGFSDRLTKAIQYEKLKANGSEELPLSDEEYQAILKEYNEYKGLMDKALKESMEKEMTFEADLLSEEAFGKLMASNDWTLSQVESLEFIVE